MTGRHEDISSEALHGFNDTLVIRGDGGGRNTGAARNPFIDMLNHGFAGDVRKGLTGKTG